MATPTAVILLGLVLTLWSYITLGWDVAWKLFVILGAAGLADMLIGWGPNRTTLSEDVNHRWKRHPWRYVVWYLGLFVAAVLMYMHFTGV